MPSRPALRPGARVVRLDATRLRVGSHPGVVVTDDPITRAVLSIVDGAQDAGHVVALAAREADVPLTTAAACLEDLSRRGAVVDAGGWPGGVPRAEIEHAALTGRDPHDLRGRRRFRLTVRADPLTAGLAELLTAATGIGGIEVADHEEPHLLVVLCAGEPSRDVLRAAARAGVPTLPVGLTDGLALVGPWHRPGRTPCLGCADRARSSWDAHYAGTLLPAITAAMPSHAADVGVLQAVSMVVTADVLAAADGERPLTVGRRVRLGPDPGAVRTDRVPFAEGCACHLLADVS